MATDYRIGIDVGGTFTDFSLLNVNTSEVTIGKVLTTPSDPSQAIFRGLTELLDKTNLKLSDVRVVVHATTLASNTLIERNGARTALITTKGFRDILETRREMRYDVYDLKMRYDEPLVPRSLITEVSERVGDDGKVNKPMEPKTVKRQLRRLVDREGVESLAVCLLHSYSNDKHERLIKKVAARERLDIPVSLSSEILPMIREYERASTTVVNAYISPVLSRYMRRIESGLKERGFEGTLYIMTSAGGLVKPSTATKFPVKLVESGPAAGAIAASYFSRLFGKADLLSFDMGGTTAKGCLLRKGLVPKSNELEVARINLKKGSGIRIGTSSVDLIEIGGGGGSIASVGSTGIVQVGPRSASAEPGPACYGRGGKFPTVTDADLVLGYLNPGFFAGGEIRLDMAAARTAMSEHIATPLGVSVEEASMGVVETIDESIAEAFSVHSYERGIDISGYGLVAFGGAGPVHAYEIARKLHCKRAIFPLRAGVFSTFGLLVSPISFDLSRTNRVRVQELSYARYHSMFGSLVEKATRLVKEAGVNSDEISVSRYLDMRYEGQGYEVEMYLDGPLPTKTELDRLESSFGETYKQIYSLALDEPVEIINFKVTVSGPQPDLQFKPRKSKTDSTKEKRKVWFPRESGYVECTVHDRYALLPGAEVSGPAVLEELDSTTVLPSAARGVVDENYSLVLEVR